MREQVERLTSEGLREDEWRRAQEQIIAAYEMGLQNNGALAQTCALDELYGLGYAHVLETEARTRALGIEDVRKAAASVLRSEQCAVSVLLPESTSEEGNDEP